MKKCPFCAEEIQSEAKKCKHCGEFLAEAVKTESKKDESWLWIGDFSRCRVLKEKEWPANVRCPKCGFHWVTKENKGDYNPVIFWILFLFFPVIGGIVYYLFSSKNTYVCPNCSNDYLEVLNSKNTTNWEIKERKQEKKTPTWVWLIWVLMVFGVIWNILGEGKKNGANNESNPPSKADKLIQATQARVQRINELHKEEPDTFPEFINAECETSDCSNEIIIINYKRSPKIQSADTIARGQAVNLSRERRQATWNPEFATVRVKVGNKIVASCRANDAKVVSCD